MKKYQRLVIKFGSNVLTDAGGALDRQHIDHLVDQVHRLKNQGIQVLLVSSGAVTAGRSLRTADRHSDKVLRRQVLSALGQPLLMQVYRESFARHEREIAQILATKEDFRDRRHYLNMKNCLAGLLPDDIIPILNENDAVAVTELMFTDNDELAGLVAAMVNAQALLILSSVDGVLDGSPGDPGSKIIPEIDPADPSFQQYILPSRSAFGRGGMHTKFRIARKAAKLGISTFIANGRRRDVIDGVLAGSVPSTRFVPSREQSNVKKWLAHQEHRPKARIYVNAGAAEALSSPQQVSSLLPVGIERIEGVFSKGDIVSIWQADREIGLGLAQYDASTAAGYIGRKGKKPLVHYDYLLIN